MNAPHAAICPTCSCTPAPWLPYAQTTRGLRWCSGCTLASSQPGLKGWFYRFSEPLDAKDRALRSRTAESLCPACAAKAGLPPARPVA